MEEIYSLVAHGGGFTFTDVWNMPVMFRRFFITMKINENEMIKKKQEAEVAKARSKK